MNTVINPKNRRKVLFLNAYFEPEHIAATHLEKDLVQGLINSDFEIEVICPTPQRGVSEETRDRYKKIKQEDLYNGYVHVIRFSAPREGKNPIVRAFRYFWCNLRTYQIGRKIDGVDVIYANSTPPTQGWIAGKVAHKKGVPFIYALQDIFPDSLVNAGMTREGSNLWKLGRRIENSTYESASRIITISEDFCKNIEKKGVKSEKIIYVPNWIDTEIVHDIPRERNKIIKRYDLDPSKFYVSYSGNLGHSQNLELLAEVAIEVQKQEKEIEFVIIGEGVTKEELAKLIRYKKINNIHLLPFQPYEDIAHVFSLGDVGLVISKPGIGGSSVPSKTWSIMAASRPVLASFDKNSALSKLVLSVQCGNVASSGNAKELLDAIFDLYANKQDRMNKGKKGREYICNNMSKNNCVNQYIKAMMNA